MVEKQATATAPQKPKPITRFVHLNPDGTANGFYSDDVHTAIPKGAVTITEAQYRQWHEGFGLTPPRRYRLVDGALVEHVPTLTLEQRAVAASVGGLTITLKGMKPIRFTTGPAALKRMDDAMFCVLATGRFSAGFTTWPMRVVGGEQHSLDVEQYRAVAVAIRSYVSILNLIADGNPLNATDLPDDAVDLT